MSSSEIEDCGFFREEDTEQNQKIIEDLGITIPLQKENTCKFCQSVPIDLEILKCFKIPVCYTCNREKLKFITKTTCKQEYLLSDDELKQFKFLTRPNPHKGTWNDMQLYLENEIRDFSIQKHGSNELIAEKKSTKKEKRKQSKLKKIKNRVKELKKKTFLPEEKVKHVHKFIYKGNGKSECDCGMKIDQEEF